MNPPDPSDLAETLRRLIEAEGPITVERYMETCLTHPRHGYYVRGEAIGAGGDFITAPEISQIFGELLGLWAVTVWQAMGAPDPVRLVELGPGRGTLMADAMRAARVLPAFRAAVRIDLVEVSPALRGLQRSALTQAGVAPTGLAWYDRFDEVPDGPLIVLANEFVDALPIRQFVRGARGWHERLVGLSPEGRLSFGLAETGDSSLEQLSAPNGAVLETNRGGAALARLLAERVTRCGGAALLVDYGHVRTGFGDTLQAVRRHAYTDPLAEPGLADLTAHVDFAALARAATFAGARVAGPVAQGRFLETLGAGARAERLAANAVPAAAAAVATGLRRLVGTGAGEMGELFKVLAIASPDLPNLPGLEDPPSPDERAETVHVRPAD